MRKPPSKTKSPGSMEKSGIGIEFPQIQATGAMREPWWSAFFPSFAMF
jgi:hypothetical protein